MAAAAAAAATVLNEEIADERRVCEDEKSAKNRFTSCRPATRVSTISGGGTGDLCYSCHTRVGACPLRRFRNDATRSFVRRAAAAAAAVVVNVVGTPVTGKNRPPPKTVFSKSRGRRGPSFNRAAHVDRSIRAPILSSRIILQDIVTDATRPGPDPREMHRTAGHRRSTDAAAVAAVLLCLACSGRKTIKIFSGTDPARRRHIDRSRFKTFRKNRVHEIPRVFLGFLPLAQLKLPRA